MWLILDNCDLIELETSGRGPCFLASQEDRSLDSRDSIELERPRGYLGLLALSSASASVGRK